MDRDSDERRLRAWLTRKVAAAAGLAAEDVDPKAPFSGYGLDSVRLMTIAGELEALLGRAVDPGVVFEFPTVAALARHLAGPPPAATAAPTGAPAGVTTAAGGRTAGRIAIVGIACRLPGAADAEAFWRLLCDGVDAVTEVPPDRWDAARLYDPDPAAPGRVASKWGGFIDGVADFDAGFFRIPAEEARRTDPQQRLLLETCWEALEDAGALPARLRGSRTGVYVGISMSEYGNRQLRDREGIGPHTSTGNALAVAANRVSYALDLRGPSVAVDTACSSSLVATHLACRALRGGECELALAGGVNLLLDLEVTIGLGKAGMLAPDGRCKPFAANANGYVRGEGCAVVVLKPLEAALAAGDRIYAVLAGSALNQDGASNGLTAPNPAAQRDVLRAAYADAGIDPATVQYVECHGTGTFLGDPIEVRALGAVLGPRPPGRVCLIGSVKSNIGHLEAAAGSAGLIKAALALHHQQIPPSLHCAEPNPHIPFDELGLAVPSQPALWPGPREGRAAGVSSFGFGGTNAHVVLEPAPERAADREPDSSGDPRGPLALPLSARSRPALEARLRAMAGRLAGAGSEGAAAVAYTAAVRRTHHQPFRLAVAADNAADLPRRVAETAADPARALARAKGLPAGSPRVAFAFSGQGSLWPGMARRLLDADLLFRSAIRRGDETLAEELGWTVEAALRANEMGEALALDDTAVAQPLLVTTQLALVRVWRAFGIEPAAVVGHSVGEVPAAVVAGLLDVETGLRLAAIRGRLMGAPGEAGRMLAVGLGRDEAAALAANAAGGVALAAMNGPRASVLAGEEADLDRIRETLAAQGVFARWLPIGYAFHSPRMQPAADALVAELDRVDPPDPDRAATEGTVPFYSTVLGRQAAAGEVDHAYWARNVREPVDFAAAVGALLDVGVDAVVEIGPDPVLHTPLRQLAAARGRQDLVVVPSLQRDRDDRRSLLDGLCRLYTLGCPVRWEHLFPDGGRTVSLPPHPWEHRRYWFDPAPALPHPGAAPTQPALAVAAAGPRPPSPLLGERIDLARGDGLEVWQSVVSLEALPVLGDHRVGGAATLPASAYVEIARAAARGAGLDAGGAVALQGLALHRALTLEEGPVAAQATLVAEGEAGYALTVHARPAGEGRRGPWSLYASGRLVIGPSADGPPRQADLELAESRCSERLAGGTLYELLADQGLQYGPAFRGVKEVRRTGGEAVGTVSFEPERGSHAGDGWPDRLRLLDAAFHVVAAAAGIGGDGGGDVAAGGPVVPVAIGRVRWWATPATTARVHARSRPVGTSGAPQGEGGLHADLEIVDGEGRLLVEVEGLELRRVASPVRRSTAATACAASTAPLAQPSLWLYEPRWRARSLAAGAGGSAGRWLILADRSDTGRRLATELRQAGGEAVICTAGTEYRSPAGGEGSIDPWDASHYRRLLDELAVAAEPLAGVVHLWSLNDLLPSPSGGLDRDTAMLPATSALHLVQALSLTPGDPPGLLVASRGCHPHEADAAPSEPARTPAPLEGTAPLGAAVWGLLKTVPIENPLLRSACVDLHPDLVTDGGGVRHLLAEIAAGIPDAEVAYDREGRRLVRRLVEAEPACPAREASVAAGTWVIGGGTGALGRRVAGWLARRGARRVVLLARDPERPGVATAVARSRVAAGDGDSAQAQAGASVQVQVVRADVADRAALAGALDAIRGSGPPVRGVVHAAGVLDDTALLRMGAASLRAVLEPKVLGGWNLHELTAGDPLERFVLFSSAAGVLGSPGQANYTAANAFLDALAHHRRRLGLPGLVIDWGPWAGGGMATDTAEATGGEARRLATATSAIDPDDGLDMLGRLLAGDRPQTVVLPFDLRDLLQFYPASSGLAFFEEIATEEVRTLKSIGVQASARPDLATEYVAPRNGVERQIAGIWERSLGIQPVGVNDSFFELGGDSVFGNQILVEINRLLGVTIDPARAFERLTVAHLAGLATEQMLGRLEQMTDQEAERLLAKLTAQERLDGST